MAIAPPPRKEASCTGGHADRIRPASAGGAVRLSQELKTNSSTKLCRHLEYMEKKLGVIALLQQSVDWLFDHVYSNIVVQI